MPVITRYTKVGGFYYTEDWFAYTFLPIRGNHVVVLKEKGLSKDGITSMVSKDSGLLPNIGFTSIVVFPWLIFLSI